MGNKIVVPISSVENIIDEFFQKDKKLTPGGAIRNSTLLACKRDFLFLRAPKLEYEPYNLSKDQANALRADMPSFAAMLVYCSAIDLLARVMKKTTGNNSSKKYFLWSAKKWFGRNNSQSIALWKMRCAMSHQYMIEKNQRAVPFGFSGSMMYDKKQRKWNLNLNGMYGDINHAIQKSHEHIKNLSKSTQQKYAKFIYEYGFFYTQAN
jgi:hypothetical protein